MSFVAAKLGEAAEAYRGRLPVAAPGYNSEQQSAHSARRYLGHYRSGHDKKSRQRKGELNNLLPTHVNSRCN